MRLQNEQKVAALVQANQKTVWDKVDKGMEIVNKLAGYANTVANFKEKTDKLSDTLNKKKDEDEKKAKENEKNDVLNTVTNLTELNELQKKYHKPVLYDECCYEGNLPETWGSISGKEMVCASSSRSA